MPRPRPSRHSPLTQSNRSIKPSFRRKPESRILGIRHALFRGISWIPAFAGTTVAWVAVAWVANDGCLGCPG